MGTWHLEIARMAMYIAFPVILFHWFNQPENFEDWVIKTRQQNFPPNPPENRAQWTEFIREFNEKKDIEELMAMENAQKKLEAMRELNKAL